MKTLTDQDVRAVCQADDHQNGEAYFHDGKVADAWQTESSLHASVAGSGARPYKVSVTAEGDTLTPKCTCPAHRRRPFCKHVSAVLIAWVRQPERFAAGKAPPAAEKYKPQSQVQRAPKPKVNQKQLQLDGLAKVEELLVELMSYGLLSPTEAQAARVADLAHTAESHKLRRLARLVTRLGLTLEAARMRQAAVGPGQVLAAAQGMPGFAALAQAFPAAAARALSTVAQVTAARQALTDESVYAGLLADAWLTAQATRRALEDPDADPTTLEELVGKTWREKDLERREDVRLLELAYETVELDTGFTVDTSYLLSLTDGAIYTEKQIVPSRFKNQPHKPSYSGLLEGTIGIYPGAGPRRIKRVEMAPEAPATDADWAQAAAWADHSAPDLFRRYQVATANPLALSTAYVLFAPARIYVDGANVWLLDAAGLAIAVADGWRVTGYLARQPVAALFGRLAASDTTLQVTPLSLITQPPTATLLRC